MPIPKRAPKRDATEQEIVSALRAVGATVEKLSQRNVPDLLVGWRGRNILIEVKSKSGKLTDGQHEWRERWRGEIHVARSAEEALEIIGVSWQSQSHNLS